MLTKNFYVIICAIISFLLCASAKAQTPQLIIPESHSADAVNITPDKQWMISISGKNVKVWNYPLGKLIKTVNVAKTTQENGREYSPIASNNQFAAFQILDSIYFLSFADLEINKRLKIDGKRTALAFSPKGDKFYMAGHTAENYDDILFQEWSMSDSRITNNIDIPLKNKGSHRPTDISFSADGSKALLADRSIGGWVINLSTKAIEKSFTKPADAHPYMYLKNGNILAFTGVTTKTMNAVILDGKTFAPLKSSKKLYTDEFGVSAVEGYNADFNVNAEKVLLSYQNKSLLLNANTLLVEKKFDTPFEKGSAQEDNTIILTNNANSYLFSAHMTEHDLKSDEYVRTFGTPLFESFIQFVFKHTNGIAMKDRTISFENGDIYMRYFKNVNFDGAIYRLSEDGKKGYVYSADNGLNIFDPYAAKPSFQHIDKVDSWGKSFVGMQVFDNLNLLTLIGDDGIYVMDLKTFKLLYIVDIPMGLEYFLLEGTEKFCDISPDGSKMVLYAPLREELQSRISLVDLSAKEEIWNYQSTEIRNLRFTNDGKNVAFTSLDSLITLNSDNGQPTKNREILPAGSQYGSATTFSPSNKIIAAKKTHFDGIKTPGDIGLYSLAQQKSIGMMQGTGDGFYNFTFLKNERYLITVEDGGICLWDVEQQRRIGKLYLFDKSSEWIFLSPDGRFDATPEALKTMYYVKGKEIIPLESLYEKYYTPGLLKQLWDKNSDEVVPDISKIKSPPKIEISIKQGERNLTVEDDNTIVQTDKSEATILTKGDGIDDKVTEIRLYQNGKLVQTTRNLTVEDDDAAGEKIMNRQFTLSLVPGKNLLKAVAINSQRTESLPAEIVVDYKPAEVKPETTGATLHLVVVGLNNYKNPKYNLNYAQADAKAFQDAFTTGSGNLFQKTSVINLFDDKATKAGIKAALNNIIENAKQQDLFVFYYAGHGVINDKKDFFLVPYDVTQLYGNDNALAQNGFSALELQEFSKNLKAQKQLFILDACQSAGAFQNMGMARGAAEEKAIAQLARATGTQWLSASGSEQFASEFEQLGHGTFTYCILQGFKGEADSGDKKLTVKELDAYLQDKVPEVTKKFKGTPQYPSSYSYGNDFPLIIIK